MTGDSLSQPNIDERMKRVDESLAIQLGRSIENNARLTRLNEAYQGQVEAGAARIAELEKALKKIADLYEGTHGYRAKKIAVVALQAGDLARTPGESQ